MKTREFLARWVGCCPVGVGFKEKFEAYARSIRTRYPGGTMDNSCDCMAQILAEGLSEALRTGYDSLGRHQGAFHFPPKQRLLLKALHRKGPVPERRLLERVYPLGQRRARQPVLKARLRKLLYDTNENLLSLGLSRVERKMHRRTDSLLLWPHEGPIP